MGFERIRRITGYLVGTLDRFNDAKRAEEHDLSLIHIWVRVHRRFRFCPRTRRISSRMLCLNFSPVSYTHLDVYKRQV